MFGTIKAVAYQAGSGICTLTLEDETGKTAEVPADAGPTLRALADCFGSAEAAVGADIFYEMTDFGTIAWLTLAEDE